MSEITFFRNIETQKIAKQDNYTVFAWEQENQQCLNRIYIQKLSLLTYARARDNIVYIVSSSFHTPGDVFGSGSAKHLHSQEANDATILFF